MINSNIWNLQTLCIDWCHFLLGVFQNTRNPDIMPRRVPLNVLNCPAITHNCPFPVRCLRRPHRHPYRCWTELDQWFSSIGAILQPKGYPASSEESFLSQSDISAKLEKSWKDNAFTPSCQVRHSPFFASWQLSWPALLGSCSGFQLKPAGPNHDLGRSLHRDKRDGTAVSLHKKSAELSWCHGSRQDWQTVWLFPSPTLLGKKVTANISGRLRLQLLLATRGPEPRKMQVSWKLGQSRRTLFIEWACPRLGKKSLRHSTSAPTKCG